MSISRFIVFVSFLFGFLNSSAQDSIKTIAGTGTQGYLGDNALAVNAELQYPTALAFDVYNNLYIADGNKIRKIDANTGIITTVAGTGTGGYNGDNILAVNAELYSPTGIAIDDSGNIYIADYSNLRVRMVSAKTGIITTVAGNGITGYDGSPGTSDYIGDNGLATDAKLSPPSSVALDAQHNLYICDRADCRIRMVSNATGIITTVAGTGILGFTGDYGVATNAELFYPENIKFDSQGNLYIVDGNNTRIRKVNTGGQITTIAGTGTSGFTGDNGKATNAQIVALFIAIDSAGNLYISANSRIRKINANTGIITTIAGNSTSSFSGDGGPALNATFNTIQELAFDLSGNLYVADGSNVRVRKIGDRQIPCNIIFTDSVVDPTNGLNNGSINLGIQSGLPITNFAWSDNNTNQNRTNLGIGTYTVTVTNSAACTTTQSFNLVHCALTSTYLMNGISCEDSADGSAVILVNNGTPPYQYRYLKGIGNWPNPNGGQVDSFFYGLYGTTYYFTVKDGNSCYAYDTIPFIDPSIFTLTDSIYSSYDGTKNGAISIGLTGGTLPYQYKWSDNAPTLDRSQLATGVYGFTATDAHGCRDTGVYHIYPLDNVKTIISVAGDGWYARYGENVPATLTWLNQPIAVAVDKSDNIYIADYLNDLIRKVSSKTGLMTTVAGHLVNNYGFGGDGGPAPAAQLDYPTSVVVDDSENIYIADNENHRIRKVTAATGIINTIAGGNYNYGDSIPATQAYLGDPHGIALDRYGNIYIADEGMNIVRKVTVSTGIITTIAGTGGNTYNGDGIPATTAQLNNPISVAVDDSGNVYIADYSNARIRKVSAATGLISTVAGTGTGGYTGDNGLAVNAEIECAYISIDTKGNLYLTDDQSIREVNKATGIITTVAGNETSGFSGDWGPAVDAQLFNPGGTAVDTAGNLFIADYLNMRIREVGYGLKQCGLQLNIDTLKNADCAAKNGFVSLIASHGIAPYQYSIDTCNTFKNNGLYDSLSPGYYLFEAKDSIGCFASVKVALTPPITDTVTQTICYGVSYAGHTTTGVFIDDYIATGGCDSLRTLNLTVLPSNNIVTNKSICQGQSFQGHDTTGTYIDTFIAFNGCDSLHILNLTVIAPIQTIVNQSICTGDSYLGHNQTGSYIDTFAAFNGCDSIRTLNLSVLSVINDSVTQTVCYGQTIAGHNTSGIFTDTYAAHGGCDSTRTLFLTVMPLISDSAYDTLPAAYFNNGQGADVFSIDTFIAASGCDSFRTLFIHYTPDTTVWPGDADADGIVDDWDLLYIGAAYGIQGPVRPNATNGWYAQYCPEWDFGFFEGPNVNHSDCNGDGTVDENDTLPVTLNYSLVHNKTNQHQRTPGAPPLYLQLTNGPLAAGDTARYNIMLGTPSIAANDVYGVAFSIQYDYNLAKANSFKRQFTNSWMGADSALLTFGKELPTGQFDVAITRIDHQNISGNGPIGQISFVTATALAGNGDSLVSQLNITHVKMINSNTADLPIDEKSDTFVVHQTVNGIATITPAPSLSIYPNPATGFVHLVSSKEIGSYFIYSPEGTEVFRKENIAGKQATIDVSNLAQGIYLLQAVVDGERVTRRFAVIH